MDLSTRRSRCAFRYRRVSGYRRAWLTIPCATRVVDRHLQFWDINTGECLATLDWANAEGHRGVVRDLKFDARLMVSGGDDKAIKVCS